jgi:hypothetical protein
MVIRKVVSVLPEKQFCRRRSQLTVLHSSERTVQLVPGGTQALMYRAGRRVGFTAKVRFNFGAEARFNATLTGGGTVYALASCGGTNWTLTNGLAEAQFQSGQWRETATVEAMKTSALTVAGSGSQMVTVRAKKAPLSAAIKAQRQTLQFIPIRASRISSTL